MKKRNLAAMGLAGVMAVGMCMPVMAADPNKVTQTSGENGAPSVATSETTVEYTAPISYELSIPAQITYTGTDDKITLSVDQNNFLIGGSNKVSVTVPDIDNFKLTQDTYEIPMQLKKGSDVVSASTAAEFTNTSNNAVEYTVERKDANKLSSSGMYTGKLVFSIAYN